MSQCATPNGSALDQYITRKTDQIGSKNKYTKQKDKINPHTPFVIFWMTSMMLINNNN